MVTALQPTVTGPDAGRATLAFERAIAEVRVGVVVAGAGLLVAGADAARTYLALGVATILVASIYAVAMVVRPRALTPMWSIIADASLTITLIAATGAARSPATAILLLVVIATAMRFQLRAALVAAGAAAIFVAVVVLLVPTPPLDGTTRAQTAVWWALMLGFGAALAGTLSKLEHDERETLAITQATATALATIDSERREFLRVVTHEIRTPIASLRALTRSVAHVTGGLDDEERNSALLLIEGHVEHLAVFSEVLQDVAGSPGLGVLDHPRLREADLAKVLEGAVASASGGARSVATAVDCPALVIRTDSTKLRRIVTNLVENALRHHNGEQPVEVRAEVAEGLLILSIGDRGPGLPEAEITAAFERYASFGQRQGTSGLGLWIVRELTRSLGGTVAAQARSGGGLLVEVRLPVETIASTMRRDPRCGPS